MHIMLQFNDMQNTTFEMLLISNNTATIEAIILLKSWPPVIKLFTHCELSWRVYHLQTLVTPLVTSTWSKFWMTY
jgi:hypothetical protein